MCITCGSFQFSIESMFDELIEDSISHYISNAKWTQNDRNNGGYLQVRLQKLEINTIHMCTNHNGLRNGFGLLITKSLGVQLTCRVQATLRTHTNITDAETDTNGLCVNVWIYVVTWSDNQCVTYVGGRFVFATFSEIVIYIYIHIYVSFSGNLCMGTQLQ